MDVGGTGSKRRTKVQANGLRTFVHHQDDGFFFMSGSWTRGMISVVRKGSVESVSSSTKRERKSKEERRKKFRLDSRRDTEWTR